MNELSRLSKENAELRAASAASEAQRKTNTEEEHRKIRSLLLMNKVTPQFFFKGDSEWTDSPESRSLSEIFQQLAPELMVERSIEGIATLLAVVFRPDDLKLGQEMRERWPIPMNMLRAWLADFQALGLITPSPKKHQVSDTREYWSITELGKTIYTETRISVLESAIETMAFDQRLPRQEKTVAQTNRESSAKATSTGS
jgi:hypothetical protein